MPSVFLHTYHEENQNWEKTLLIQRTELPSMETELSHSSKSNPGELQQFNALHYKTMLERMAGDLDQILLKIQKQQHRITGIINQTPGQISLTDLLYHQEDLRDEVLAFEQEYIELKKRIHQYFLS